MNDIYDIDGIISHALSYRIDISPSDRQEWKMFCCALKVLGYDEHTFVALSSGDARDSRSAWRSERHPQRYRSEQQAKGMIVALAKEAGMDVKQYLLSRNKEMATAGTPTPPPRPKPSAAEKTVPAAPREYLPMAIVDMGAELSKKTSLYAFLCTLFDPTSVERVFNLYRVGASKYVNERQGGRAVSYPYINVDGNCVDCKVMHVNPNTGSRKTAPPLRSWTDKDGSTGQLPTTSAMFELKKNHLRAPWCNFGDHLLHTRPDAKVCIVESEKSAIVLSLAYPDRLWVAVGSVSNLNPERLKPYRGRKITIYPDRDGFAAWCDKAKSLAKDYDMSVDTTINRYEGDSKDDLADIVIRSLRGTQAAPLPQEPKHRTYPPPIPKQQLEAISAWNSMAERYPELNRIGESLGLTPVRVEPCTPEDLMLCERYKARVQPLCESIEDFLV